MRQLEENEVMKLKVGNMVVYKERSGELAHFLYKAKVVGIYPRFILLSCGATTNPLKDYEDCERYFNASFNYIDAHKSHAGNALYEYGSALEDFYNFGEL